MASQAQTQVCYRHPGNQTAVTCSDCERPICPDCMVFGPVGIRCPECAGQPTGIRKATTGLRTAAGEGTGAVVTKALIGANVGIFMLELAQPRIVEDFALYAPALAAGEWWRLLTSAFLHGDVVHILFNMVMLWWFGSPLEALLGRGRFVGLYLVSALAGSAGALLLAPPNARTVGASGAVFGILGAGLLLERKRIYVFGGGALVVVLLNLVLSFRPGISLGGHLGGLLGGMLAVLALSRFGRGHAAYGRVGLLGIAGLVVVAIVSVAIAYARVRGLA